MGAGSGKREEGTVVNMNMGAEANDWSDGLGLWLSREYGRRSRFLG